MFEKKTYSSRLLADDPVIRDHSVHGEMLLPGVAFLDLILRIARSAGHDVERLVLRKVLFLQPVALREGQSCDLRVRLEPRSKHCLVVAEGRVLGKEEWVGHVEAEVHEVEPLGRSAVVALEHVGQQRPVEDVYAMARKAGIRHRGFMLPTGAVSVNGLEVRARLSLSDEAREYLPDFLLHPAMLDASTVLGAAPTLVAGDADKAYIPVYIHEFRATGPLPVDCWVTLHTRPARSGADLHSVDIELHDEEGRLVAAFHRLDAKRIRSAESMLPSANPARVEASAGAQGSSPASKSPSLLDYLQATVGEYAGRLPSEVPLEIGFYDQGLDSKNLLQIVQRLEKDLARDFYPTLLFEYPNLNELAAYLTETLGGDLKIPGAVDVSVRQSEVATSVDLRVVHGATEGRPGSIESNIPTVASEGSAGIRSGAIAIIGIAGRYPMAPNLEVFWENLKSGKDCIGEVPASRWDWRQFHDGERGREGKSYSRWGSWLEDHDCFDGRLFHISPLDAARMDPQERLFLETVWAVLEDAGYAPRGFSAKHDRRVGVFAGAMWSEYQLFAGQAVANSWHASIANRASYFFDFRGPSMAVDTMCSSSLLAVHMACESLRRGECLVAVAGGVNLSLHPQKYSQLSQMHMLSSDGRCRSFGEGGDGYVPGEGVGAVLLKPLEAAERDGDRIDAVILGGAVNHGGATGGYTVPSPQAQAALLREAWKSAGIDPRTLSYVEAHGTGTSLGDPIEIEGLAKAFREFPMGGNRCAVGSVKSNLGHLEAAAGIAALTKVVLQLRHRELAPSIHSETLNPKIDWSAAPVVVQRSAAAWNGRNGGPLRAGVSSFGAGGTNVHLVVEEGRPGRLSPAGGGPEVIVLSARDTEALQSSAENLRDWLRVHPKADMRAVASTLQLGREALPQRLALTAVTVAEAAEKLDEYCQGKLDRIRSGRATQSTSVVTRDQPVELALAWVAGARLDWASEGGKRPVPLSLPTYPFARERHWVGEQVTLSKAKIQLPEIPTLQQLLSDHVVGGKAVLPGAVFLSMALQRAGSISRLVWKRVGESAEVELVQTDAGWQLMERISNRVLAEAVQAVPPEQPEAIDVASVRSRCPEIQDAQTIYDGFKKAGLVYGKSLRGIRQWHLGPNEVVAELNAGGGEAAAVDLALQAVAPLLPRDGVLRVPRGIGHATRHLEISSAAWVVATRDGSGAYSATLTTAGGEVVATLRQIEFAVIDQASLVICAPRWQACPLTAMATRIDAQALILLDHGDSRFRDWRGKVGLPPLVLVEPGAAYAADEGGKYRLRPDLVEDWKRLFDSLGYDPRRPLALINHWMRQGDGLVNGSHRALDRESVQAGLSLGVASVFHLTQELLSRKPKAAVRLVHCAHGPLDATVAGFGRALKLENPRFQFQVLRGGDPLSELGLAAPVESEVDFESSTRRVRSLCLVDKPAQFFRWREKGVYLITGGLGGLGLLVARHLAAMARARLVLVGRSEPSASQLAALDTLRSIGSEVLHVAADVSQPASVCRVVKMARQKFGALNGVIHCAGLVRDAFLQKKTAAELDEVLRPKVVGTINLDAATAEDSLDFFLLFSSLSGLMGNAGQTDYSAGNAFQGAFAEWRAAQVRAGVRKGQTLCIDWPLWSVGGMGVDATSAKLLRQTSGLEALPATVGLSAMEQALSSRETRVAIAYGDRRRLTEVLGVVDKPPVAVPAAAHSNPNARVLPASPNPTPSSIGSGDEAASSVRTVMVEVLSEILRLRPADVDFDADISEFGFDSITLTGFVAELNSRLSLKVNPAALYEHPNLGSFQKYLLEESREASGSNDASLCGVKAESNQVLKQQSEQPLEAIAQSTGRIASEPLADEFAGAVAVVGMAGVFPESDDIDEFWRHLLAGDDLIREIPSDRWDWRAYHGDPHLEPNKTYSKWGGFIRRVDAFDAQFFGISRREAELMDPQQRLFLQTAWHALEDAGIPPAKLKGTRTGVFVGAGTSDYSELVVRHQQGIEAHMSTGLAHSLLANRVSYLLDFRGPSEVIDTACSSSLVAVHRAVRALLDDDCDAALAGGVNVMLTPTPFIAFSQAGLLSRDGRCKTFDKRANGYVRGEGCGAVVLKRLATARADGDRIYAIIRSTAVSHGGHASSLTAPNPSAQADLLIKAYQRAGFAPQSLGYVETHGTGTALGDPIEVNGLKKAFAHFAAEGAPAIGCGLGSVKSNIGHLETAAGVASLIKAVLSVYHRTLPASLHVEELNPNVQLDGTAFRIVTKTEPWVANDSTARRAGVSSFGFGGAYAHVVLEEVPQRVPLKEHGDATQLLVLSARDPATARVQAGRLARHFRANPELNLADVAWTLQTGRATMEARLLVLARSLMEAADKLELLARGEFTAEGVFEGMKNGHANAAHIFGNAPEDKDYVRKLGESRQLVKLAQLWSQGVDIDWSELGGTSGQIVSLPGYPFKQERHWIELDPVPANPSKLPPVTGRPSDEIDSAHFYRPRWQAAESLPAGEMPSEVLLVGEGRWPDFGALPVVRCKAGQDCPARPFKDFVLMASPPGRGDNPAADCLRLLDLVQRLLKARPEGRIRGVYLHYGAPSDRAVIAFARALRLEHPQFSLSTLESDRAPSSADLIAELTRLGQPESITLREGRRHVQRLERIETPRHDGVSLRRRGVYVVTGGLSGLGIRLGCWLGREFAARVVVLGRGIDISQSDARLDEIRKSGAEVLYAMADVSNGEEVELALESARKVFGPLNGVFHLARTVQNGAISTKTAAQFEQSTAAKTLGAIHLDNFTKADPLDCFLLFSSLAATVGLPHASDYGWACAFQERFSEERARRVAAGERKGRSLAVAWSQWAQDRYSTPERDQNLARLGFKLIEAEEGMLALAAAMTCSEPVVVVAMGDRSRIEGLLPLVQAEATVGSPASLQALSDEDLNSLLKRLLATEQAVMKTEARAAQVASVVVQPVGSPLGAANASREPAGDLVARDKPFRAGGGPQGGLMLRERITAIFASQLKVQPSELDPERDILACGLDSISALVVANRLQKELGRTVDPKLFFDYRTIAKLAEVLGRPEGEKRF